MAEKLRLFPNSYNGFNWEWTANGTDTNYECLWIKNPEKLIDKMELMGNSKSAKAQTAMLIPQNLADVNAYIGLLVNIKTTKDNATYFPTAAISNTTNIDGTKYGWIIAPLKEHWIMGTYFKYNINLTTSAVTPEGFSEKVIGINVEVKPFEHTPNISYP